MPKILKLRSLSIVDPQEGSTDYVVDQIRFRIILDGNPVRELAWSQTRGIRKDFTDRENRGGLFRGSEFIFWSTADVIVYEADDGTSYGSPLDMNMDDWVQTIRLDHPNPEREDGRYEAKIGKTSERASSMNGRSDTEYELRYSLEEHVVTRDEDLRTELGRVDGSSEMVSQSNRSGDFERDKGDCRWICSIDGGGLRGIFPLRLLEQLEAYYNKSCFEMFDMFAGTSTGSIIASLLATGHSLQSVISLYKNQTIRRRLFQSNKRGQSIGFRYFNLRGDNINNPLFPQWYSDWIDIEEEAIESLIDEASHYVMTPKYKKVGMKALLYQVFSQTSQGTLQPIRLRDCGRGDTPKDIMLTARDLHRGETTFFTAFHMPFETDEPLQPEALDVSRMSLRTLLPGQGEQYPHRFIDVVTGTYQDVLLKDAVEASASAPVYFSPRANFSDGGIGAHNNPAFMAAIEALMYSDKDTNEPPRTLMPKYTPYQVNGSRKSGTAVWSFGTAYRAAASDLPADVATLIGGSFSLKSRTDNVLYWIDQVIENLMLGANQEQDFLCREILADKIKYLRFNLGVNEQTLYDLSVLGDRAQQLSSIKLDAVDSSEFDVMDEIAQRFALAARDNHFGFENGGYRLPAQPPVSISTYATNIRQGLARYE